MFHFIKQSLTQFRFLTVSARPLAPKSQVGKHWSNEEDQILREACVKYGSNWSVIAHSLPDRTPGDCAKRFPNLAPTIAHWTEDENRLLREKVAQYGFRWKILADSYFPNRTPAQLANHWTAVENPRQDFGTWLPEEEKRLLNAVQIDKLSWASVAERVGTRNQWQCRFKYLSLTQSNPNDRFTDDEDKVILDTFKRYPNDWKAISLEVKKMTGIKRLPKHCRAHYDLELDPRLVKGPWTAQEDKIIVDAYNRYGPKVAMISQLLPNYRGRARVWQRITTLRGNGIIKSRKSEDET
ncbi:Homeodomain-like protein [Jimgerdemannia flammicorona]|uniref:Homeodomain-like protein n=1 Tax=Jimgerdemannia flammicorona TaxID=994334 RepID=A0A433DDJ9_9FUNG|nr:Homeodomain-like protein [Jimgerdemannia flammicorona]